MKTIFTGIVLLAFYFSCSTPTKKPLDKETVKQEIIDVEHAFSNYSKQHGFAKALAEYAADDVIKLNPNTLATVGKAQLQQEAATDSIGSSAGELTWKPLKVDVSESGDMASSFGDWYFSYTVSATGMDTTLYGNYITVWKKQKEGTWKFILDGGNQTPGPTIDSLLMNVF